MNLSTIVDQGLKVSPNTHIRMCSKYERDQIFYLDIMPKVIVRILCQHKLSTKATKSLYSVIQWC